VSCYVIRSAGPGDIDTLVSQARDFVGEAPNLDTESFRPSKVKDALIEATASGFVFVAEREGDGAIVGWVAGGAARPWWGAELVLDDLALYVVPEERAKPRGCAIALVAAMENWGVERGIEHAEPGVTSGSTAALRLYERLGYQVVGYRLRRKL